MSGGGGKFGDLVACAVSSAILVVCWSVIVFQCTALDVESQVFCLGLGHTPAAKHSRKVMHISDGACAIASRRILIVITMMAAVDMHGCAVACRLGQGQRGREGGWVASTEVVDERSEGAGGQLLPLFRIRATEGLDTGAGGKNSKGRKQA